MGFSAVKIQIIIHTTDIHPPIFLDCGAGQRSILFGNFARGPYLCKKDSATLPHAKTQTAIIMNENGRLTPPQAALIERLRERTEPVRVLFVCLGNICRSPAAEGVMRAITDRRGRHADWIIDSAGTGNYHIGELPDRRMRIHAQRRGYELTHRCRQVRSADFDDFDLIIPMDASNERNLRALAPSAGDEAKIIPMASFVRTLATRFDHIPDPYYEGAEGFELVLDLLDDACEHLFSLLSAKE